jgi:hypothetical protein
MRRLLFVALGALLVLAGCGTPPPPRPTLQFGLVGEPFGAAPAIAAEDRLPLPLHLARGQAALAAPFLIAPSTLLPQLATQGFVALGAACSSPPDVLLWHGEGLFSWRDLRGQPLYVAPGADAQALGAAIARYAGVLSPLPEPISQTGGVAAFERNPAGFLLAPEPLATALFAKGKAALAQALPDELGPYPTCLLYTRRETLAREPLLSLQIVRALNLGLWRLSSEDPGQLALALRPLDPAVSPTSLLRALLTARAERVFPDSLYLSPAALQRLEQEFPGGRLPQGAVDTELALRALRDPFAH